MLLIDDDELIREVAGASLELVAGWRVLTAGSGEEGLGIARNERLDAIVLDVMMPGMDGPTTFGQLHGDPRTADIPVVLMTAKVQESEVARYLDLGVAGVITKPFEAMSLPQRISELVGW